MTDRAPEAIDTMALRKLAEGVTETIREWSHAQGAFNVVVRGIHSRNRLIAKCGSHDHAAFIAAADPATVLALLDQLDAAMTLSEPYRALIGERDDALAEAARLREELTALIDTVTTELGPLPARVVPPKSRRARRRADGH